MVEFGERVWRHTEPPEDLQVRAERDNRIFALGYEPTEQYIAETYGPGWQKKAAPELPPADPSGPLPAEFTEISELAMKQAGHRADQAALVAGAERLAAQYRELYGKRVEQILGYLEETDDVDTFKRRLVDMLADPCAHHHGQRVQRREISGAPLSNRRGIVSGTTLLKNAAVDPPSSGAKPCIPANGLSPIKLGQINTPGSIKKNNSPYC